MTLDCEIGLVNVDVVYKLCEVTPETKQSTTQCTAENCSRKRTGILQGNKTGPFKCASSTDLLDAKCVPNLHHILIIIVYCPSSYYTKQST